MLKAVNGTLLKIAELFAAKPDTMFKKNEYQVLRAAQLAANTATRQALCLQAGGGKTFIILMLS